MHNKKINLIIFDQSLSTIDGHSYQYVKNVYTKAKKLFFSVKLYTNLDFLLLNNNDLKKNINGSTNYIPVKFFKRIFFQIFPKVKKKEERRKVIRGIFNIFMSIDYFIKIFLIIKKLKKDEKNIIFIQYFDESIYWLLRLLKLFNVNIDHVKFNIVLRYEFSHFGIKKFFPKLKKMILSNYFHKKTKFFTDNIVLSKKNNLKFRKNLFSTLPIIILPFNNRDLKKIIDKKKEFVISCLGPLRSDKGAKFIKKILQNYDLIKNKIVFNIQVNNEKPFDDQFFSNILKKNITNINFLKGPFTQYQFLNRIKNSDALLCPYDKKKYSLSTSNIFLEGIFLNTPVIFTKGTWASNIINEYNDKNIFLGCSIQRSLKEFHRSINFIKKNSSKISRDLKSFKKIWKKDNNYKIFFEKISY